MSGQEPPLTIETDPDAFEPAVDATFESRPIGEYLRRQRILRGMSTEELAALTRIPLRSLERLEGGHFDGETDGFVRGFVRTVANALGLDAEDAISRMLREPTPGSWERRVPGHRAKRGLLVLALCLGLVVGFFALRAGWRLLLGTASRPASREVLLWQDPVRALAEATGARLDPSGAIDPIPQGAGSGPSPSSPAARPATEP